MIKFIENFINKLIKRLIIDKIKFIEELQYCKIKKGDILVLTISNIISSNDIERIQEIFRDLFPETRVIILEKGYELQIINPQDFIGGNGDGSETTRIE